MYAETTYVFHLQMILKYKKYVTVRRIYMTEGPGRPEGPV